MSREIKFRCWSNNSKQMINEGGFIVVDGNGNFEVFNESNGSWGSNRPSEYELMQFTGLLDKKGKDVYEGDIVIGLRDGCIEFPHVKAVVIFEGGCFVENYFRRDLRIYTACSYGYGNCLEVIGNIYENPELLKRGEEYERY